MPEDEEDEEDPARGTTDRGPISHGPSTHQSTQTCQSCCQRLARTHPAGRNRAQTTSAAGMWAPKVPGGLPEHRGSPRAAAAQDTRGETGTTGKVSCLLVSPNYAEGPYHRLHLFCLYSTGLVACLTMHGTLFSLQPLKPQN